MSCAACLAATAQFWPRLLQFLAGSFLAGSAPAR